MITFNQIYNEAQEQVMDTSATTLTILKRAINQGNHKFNNVLRREYTVQEKTFDTVADQQYYQLPEDCVRPKTISIEVGGVIYVLTEVDDDDTWLRINSNTDSSDVPELYFVKGSDQIGIYPIPSGANTATLRYEPKIRDMSADDYTTGTITVTNGSANVVGSGTTFTANMVGRYLFVTDGSADGMAYKITSFTDATHITLENVYAGTTGGSKTYLVGECPNIPEEYHESLIDYACYRYYLRRKDPLAKDFKAIFDDAMFNCQEQYGSKSTSTYIAPPPNIAYGYVYINRNFTVT